MIETKEKNNFLVYNDENTAFNTESEVLFNEGSTFKLKSI